MNVKVQRKEGAGYGAYDQFDGFTKLDEIEWDNESYAFNITGLWVRDSDGTVWTADDSGCSCPIPWEGTDELERLFSIERLVERYKTQTNTDGDGYRYGSVNANDWESFKGKAEAALAALAAR